MLLTLVGCNPGVNNNPPGSDPDSTHFTYYPMQVGNRWVYQTNDSRFDSIAYEIVDVSQDYRGLEAELREYSYPGAHYLTSYALLSDGELIFHTDGQSSEPVVELKTPLRVGANWVYTEALGTENSYTITATVLSMDSSHQFVTYRGDSLSYDSVMVVRYVREDNQGPPSSADTSHAGYVPGLGRIYWRLLNLGIELLRSNVGEVVEDSLAGAFP